MTQCIFLQPLDVLFLRGNKLFGDPGSFGEALVPPWPSVAAGALRSRMLADSGLDWNPARRKEPVPEHPQLGTPDRPGSFTVTAFHPARRFDDGRVEMLVQPPADLIVGENSTGKPEDVQALHPCRLADGLKSSMTLPMHPVLAERERGKPEAGYWLSQKGWRQYLNGEVPAKTELVHASQLWKLDHRVGVGLDGNTGRAEDGRLFSMQAVAMLKRGDRLVSPNAETNNDEPPKPSDHDTGFLAIVAGAEVPAEGMVRLGGDARAAALSPADCKLPQPDYAAIASSGRCRLVLTSPGIFKQGWLPTGASQPDPGQGARFDLYGVSGRIVAAAVPRAEVISGWDLAHWSPKPAERAAPAGSVWWLELDEGVTADALGKLAERGFWDDKDYGENMRRAEGFNRLTLAQWR